MLTFVERHRSIFRPIVAALLVLTGCGRGSRHDLVLAHGRVMDPESGLDGIRWVAIDSGRISAIFEPRLRGREVLDVTGLVVAPGFIDLYVFGQDTTSVVI
jgi:predicted amidohydrolase